MASQILSDLVLALEEYYNWLLNLEFKDLILYYTAVLSNTDIEEKWSEFFLRITVNYRWFFGGGREDVKIVNILS